MSVVMVTANGEQHGLINRLTNAVPFDDYKSMTPEHKAECIRRKKEDSRIVKGKVIAKNGKQERLTKAYCLGSGEPILQYNLIPGQVYDLPKGFVDEVNAKKGVKRSGLVSVDGKEINPHGAPLAQDEFDEPDFQIVPISF